MTGEANLENLELPLMRNRRLPRAAHLLAVMASLAIGCSTVADHESATAEVSTSVPEGSGDATSIDVCALLATSVEGIEVPLARVFADSPRVQRWTDGVSAVVFVYPEVDPGELQAIGDRLSEDPKVESSSYVDQDGALAEFEQLMADSDDLLEAVDASDLPTSFRVVLVDGAVPPAEWIDDYRDLPGVYQVVTPSPSLVTFFDLISEGAEQSRMLPSMSFGELLAHPFLFDGVRIFVRPNADLAGVESIRATLEEHPGVRTIRYLDSDAAIQEFEHIFGADSPLRDAVDENSLPTSYRVVVDDPTMARELAEAIRKNPDVQTVTETSLVVDGGHLALALVALDQPEAADLVAALVRVGPQMSLGEIDRLVSTIEALHDFPGQWLANEEWGAVIGDGAFVETEAWLDAVEAAESVHNTMVECGIDTCTSRSCVHLMESFFPELVDRW